MSLYKISHHVSFLACKDPTKYVFEKCMKCTYKYVETTLWKIMAWNLNNNFPRDSTRFKSPLSKLRKDIWGIGFGHTSFFTWHFLKVKHPVVQVHRGKYNTLQKLPCKWKSTFQERVRLYKMQDKEQMSHIRLKCR